MVPGIIRQNFSVLVVDPHNKPLEGVKVEIREISAADLDALKTGLTDKEGRVSFKKAESGRFALCYSHLQGGDCPAIQISDSQDGKGEVQVQWPAHPIQKVKRIVGAFLLQGTKYALSQASVSVTDAWTGDVVGETATDTEGHFEVDGTKPGLYVLKIQQQFQGLRPKMLLEGNIFIEVAPDADEERLPVFPVTMSSCGLTAEVAERKWIIF